MQITVTAFWDDEARVWVATHDDLGIAADADTLDGLNAKLCQMLPEAIELNGHDPSLDDRVPFDLLVHHDHHALA